jgi:MFS family permease
MNSQGSTSGDGGGARVFALLSVAALAAMVQVAILPSLTQMSAHFSGRGAGAFDGAAIAQLVSTIASLTIVLGAPVAGWIAERRGKRPVFLVSAVIYAISGVSGAFAVDLWTLLASRMVLGFAAAGMATVGISLLGDYYAREKRDRLIGWFAIAGGAGALVSLLAAGGLARMDWRAPFGLYLVGFVVFAVAFRVIKEPARVGTEAVGARGGGSIRKAFGFFLLMLVISIATYMVTVQGPFLLASRGIVNPQLQAVVAVVATASSMISAYLFGSLRSRFGFASILTLIWVALGLGTLGLGMSASLAAIVFFAALSGFGSGFTVPLMQSAILNVVPPAVATRAMGISVACIFLGQFIQPFVIAPLRSAVGVQEAFVWVGAVALVAGAMTLLWREMKGTIQMEGAELP